jgi:hypothetical protein
MRNLVGELSAWESVSMIREIVADEDIKAM